MSEYYAGLDCSCGACCKNQCACDADWTDPEIYKLRAEIAELEIILGKQVRHIAKQAQTAWHDLQVIKNKRR